MIQFGKRDGAGEARIESLWRIRSRVLENVSALRHRVPRHTPPPSALSRIPTRSSAPLCAVSELETVTYPGFLLIQLVQKSSCSAS